MLAVLLFMIVWLVGWFVYCQEEHRPGARVTGQNRGSGGWRRYLVLDMTAWSIQVTSFMIFCRE